jgi:hypothetical protein
VFRIPVFDTEELMVVMFEDSAFMMEVFATETLKSVNCRVGTERTVK